jgi:hypothetical protein
VDEVRRVLTVRLIAGLVFIAGLAVAIAIPSHRTIFGCSGPTDGVPCTQVDHRILLRVGVVLLFSIVAFAWLWFLDTEPR